MRLTFARNHETEPTAAPPRPMVGLVTLATRTDMTCSTCGHVIAYGVRPERVQADAAFFLEAHKPFCMGMRAAG